MGRVRRRLLLALPLTCLALLAIVVATSFLLPWYTVWDLPLAAISADRRLLAATLFV